MFRVFEKKNGYALIDRRTQYEPYVVVYNYNEETQTWDFGFYFDSIIKACEFFQNETIYKNSITLEGYSGTWEIIDNMEIKGNMYFLLENEQWGDEIPCIIINNKNEIMLDDVWNGFDDLKYLFVNNN